MLEKVALMNLLFDFYGQLLTERQRSFMELYYSHDLSLGEIALEFGVSRQAVHDILKRAGQTLESYEAKLGFVKKFVLERKKLAEAGQLLDDYRISKDEAKLARAREILSEVLDMS